MTTKKQIEAQRINPDPDFDFRNEKKPDNTRPPVGRPANGKGK